MSKKPTVRQTLFGYAAVAAVITVGHIVGKDSREQEARDNANPDVMVDQYCARLTRDASDWHGQFMRRATGDAKGVLFELTKDDCLKIMAEKKAAAPAAPKP